MQDTARQYKGDKSGLQLDPQKGKVQAPGNVSMYKGTKEQLTVLITTRADGIVYSSPVIGEEVK